MKDEEISKKWWDNLPKYNMDKPCQRVLSNLYYQREPSSLSDSEIEEIWRKVTKPN